MDRRNSFFAVLLICALLFSAIVTFQMFNPTVKTSPSQFYVGIEFGYGNSSDCKALIDKVQNYTNLIVISSPNITENEATLNDTCDYAYVTACT